MKTQHMQASLIVLVLLAAGAWSAPRAATGSTAPPLSSAIPTNSAPSEINPHVTGGALAEAPNTRPVLTSKVIKAVIVRSWEGCDSDAVVWADLNANWSDFGSVPIYIDYVDTALCKGPITYEALIANGADVVIISDPAGGLQQYSADEIAAIEQYAQEGHGVLGTYLLLKYYGIDNTGLASVFGLPTDAGYRQVPGLVQTYEITPGIPLFTNITDPYVTNGHTSSQGPVDSKWNKADLLNNARFLGMASGRGAAIIGYEGPGYRALYITNMPEYDGSSIDKQFLYNAVVGLSR